MVITETLLSHVLFKWKKASIEDVELDLQHNGDCIKGFCFVHARNITYRVRFCWTQTPTWTVRTWTWNRTFVPMTFHYVRKTHRIILFLTARDTGVCSRRLTSASVGLQMISRQLTVKHVFWSCYKCICLTSCCAVAAQTFARTSFSFRCWPGWDGNIE